MSSMINYKGYVGSVEYRDDDKLLFGKLQYIRSLISYEAEDIRSLINAFESAVDNYLKFCEEQGIKPERPFKGSFNVRVSPEVHRKAVLRAEATGTSLNKLVERALEREVG